MGRRKIKRGLRRQIVDGKQFWMREEVEYIQQRAAECDGRIVTVMKLVLFSTDTGDAWMLDPEDMLAMPLARDGVPLPVHIEETEANFAIGWSGSYQIDEDAFVFADKNSGRVRTILGYPTRQLAQQIAKLHPPPAL